MERIENLQQALQWYDELVDDFNHIYSEEVDTIIERLVTSGKDFDEFFDNDLTDRERQKVNSLFYDSSYLLVPKYGIKSANLNDDPDYVLEHKDELFRTDYDAAIEVGAKMAYIFETAMIEANDSSREYLWRRLKCGAKTFIQRYTKQDGKDLFLLGDDAYLLGTIERARDCLYLRIGAVFSRIVKIAPLFGYDISDVGLDVDYIENIRYKPQEPQEEQKPYKTMPRSHRIAAVYKLLNAAGVNESNTDRTVMAGIVEAVTGGNIETKPCDTTAYKRPERTAIKGADECLKPIAAILDKKEK